MCERGEMSRSVREGRGHEVNLGESFSSLLLYLLKKYKFGQYLPQFRVHDVMRGKNTTFPKI